VRRLLPAALALTAAISFVSGCSHRIDPETAFDHARKTYRDGNLADAEKEADDGHAQFHSLSPEWAWKFTLLKANALHGQRKDREVLKTLASETAPAPSGELAVKRLRVEGQAYASLNDVQKAEGKLGEAQRICSANDYVACGDVYSARGALEMNRQNYGEAHALFAKVLPRARVSGNYFWEASALLDLSWAADEEGHFDEAVDFSNEARKISVERGFPDLAQAALGNMGWAYYKLGDIEKAEELLAEAERQAAKLADFSDQVKWLTNAGYTYMDAGKAATAQELFLQSLDLARKIQSRDDIINSLIALAFVSEQTGKLDDAKRYADETLRMARDDHHKRDETYPLLVQGRIAAQQHDAVIADAALNAVAQSPDSPVFLKWEAERSLGRLYEDENHPDEAAREYRTALSTFESARAELQHENSRLPFLNNATHIYDDYIHLLIKQGKTNEALQVADYSRARTLSEGLGVLKPSTKFQPDPLNAPQIAKRAGGSILFYWLGDKQSYVWLITPQKVTLVPLPAAGQIEPLVQRYRKALIGLQDPLTTQNEDGASLYRILVAPVQPLLAKNTKVFVVPDGSLNTLNFETLLVDGPTPHYWIEDVALTDASSLRMLAAARPESKHSTGLLLLGNSISPSPDYPELRKASDEMADIAKHFPGQQQQVFARDQATPSAYLSGDPQKYSFIHFVAHGTASRLSPLDSAIVLSKANAQDDSFKLYARDIIQHPLRADLVTISTCYGAGSRAYSGEGLVGLSWAFLRAGAHNVIGALWEVSDVSTPQLMDDLYSGLQSGKAPDAALRAAKLSVLHSNSPFRKPFYWAPFQLYTGS